MLLPVHRLCLPYSIICLLILTACSEKTSFDDILTSPARRKDYLDITRIEGTLEAVNNHSYNCPGIYSDLTILYLIEEGTPVTIGDTLCVMEARELENQYLQALIEFEKAETDYLKSKADLDLQYLVLDTQVKNIEVTTEISRLDSLQMKFTSPSSREIIMLELKKAEIQQSSLMKKLELLEQINTSELLMMKLRITQQQNQVDQTERQLGGLILTAGVEGIVIYAISWVSGVKVREGDVVWADMPIIQIPDMSRMHVKMEVRESVYKRLAIDQAVTISVDAYPDIVMEGRIKYKAPVGKPVIRDSEVKIFEVTASLDSSSLEIQPGLAVTCDVLVKSILDTIVVPVVTLFDQDSIKIVYVAENDGFIIKEITVSEYNNTEAVIKRGLKGNEILALMKPPESLIHKLMNQ